MKRKLLTFALTVLTVGLLGSCSKINERIDGLDKRVYDLENNQIASIEQQITAINTSITDLKAADETIGGKIGDLKTTAETLQTLIDALKEADKALVQKDEALEARIATLEGQVAVINGQIKALEDADKAINARIDELKSYIDTELGKTKDWASATFATLEEYRQTAADLATLSVTVSGISNTLAAVQTSITTLDTKIDGIDAALQGKIADAKTELEGKISSLKTELEGKITEAISTSEDNLKGWVNEQLSGYYTIAQTDAKIKSLQDEIDILNTDNETNKTKIAELETKLNNLSAELTQAKATIKTEYEAAIKKAIENHNGEITQTINQKIAEVNATIAALTARVETLETTVGILAGRIDAAEASIATINQQISAINQSISDLETIRTNIQALIDAKNAMGEDITVLTAADQILEGKINDLKTYVDTELANYATTDWVNGTFATLENQEEIIADIEQLKQDLAGLDSKLDQAIANLDSSLKGWVNEQLSGYYTIAEIGVIIAGLQDEIDILDASDAANKTKIAELEANLAQLTQALEEAKTTIKTEYEAAIATAISEYNGTITQTIQTKIDEVNATIAALTAKVEVLETNVGILSGRIDAAEASINTINQQIAAINQSISDLETIRTNIQALIDAKNAMGEDITALTAADQILEGKINDLKTYVDTELANYATTDWVNGTFATLENQEEIIADIEQLKQDLAGLDSKLDQAIANLDSSLKGWVNEQLSGYYTIAEIGVIIAGLQSEIDDLETKIETNQTDIQTNKNKIAELEANLAQLTQALEEAKTTIKTEYEAAIAAAITEYNGIITQTINQKIAEVNATITALTARVGTLEAAVSTLQADVAALKAMIQSVSITPAYSDGSVEADENGILTLKCIVSPAEALNGMESLKDNLLIYADYVKVKTKSSPAYTEITVSEATVLDDAQGAISVKADISEYLPEGTDKALTVALKITNGISNYTTEFVPVYVVAPSLPEGALAGEFSVSATKKVHFSQGNLYYDGSAFKFEANQYDFRTYAGKNSRINGESSTTGTPTGHWGLFGWVGASSTQFTSSPEIYGVSTSNTNSHYGNSDSDALKADWGTAIDDKGTWSTLSEDEWTYLFNTRTMTYNKSRYSNAVFGVSIGGATYKGVFIYPDNYSGDVVSGSMTWDQINAAGIVFLPAAGYRNGSTVTAVGSLVFSWSSAAYDGSKAYTMYFAYDGPAPDSSINRCYGLSVRLITDVK